MNRSMYFGVVFLSLTTLIGAAFAGETVQNLHQGLYMSLTGGVVGILDSDAYMPNDGDKSTTSYDLRGRIGGAVGYDFTNHFGIEAEASHADVSPNHVTLYGDPNSYNFQKLDEVIWSVPADGRARAVTLMGNFIFRDHWGVLTPYIGVGGGWAWMYSKTDIRHPTYGPLTFADNDQTWVAQGFVGLDMKLNRDLSIGVRYRVQEVGSFDLYDGLIDIDETVWMSGEVTLKLYFR